MTYDKPNSCEGEKCEGGKEGKREGKLLQKRRGEGQFNEVWKLLQSLNTLSWWSNCSDSDHDFMLLFPPADLFFYFQWKSHISSEEKLWSFPLRIQVCQFSEYFRPISNMLQRLVIWLQLEAWKKQLLFLNKQTEENHRVHTHTQLKVAPKPEYLKLETH